MTQTEADFLQSYDASAYEKPSVAVDIVVFSIGKGRRETYRQLPKSHLQMLLIRRKNHPFKDCWALPGGFVDIDESLRHGSFMKKRDCGLIIWVSCILGVKWSAIRALALSAHLIWQL